jgi:GDP-D-mannose 3', 5'-epimerase
VDLKRPEFSPSRADYFLIMDLRDVTTMEYVLERFKHIEEVYQLAADMGGAGYIFSGTHDADVMHNSALINMNVAESLKNKKIKLFYSSSACIYPAYNQSDPNNPNCVESSAYPAAPDSEYGWEKLFSERLYTSYWRNYALDIRIARFHNIFGPEGSYNNGKEKAPAAICRKVSEVENKGYVEIWGDGRQTRSFLYIDECIEGIRRLMESEYKQPVNIGSEEMISIGQLTEMVMKIANKTLFIVHTDGPQGVRGRNSDNDLIQEKLNWKPSQLLEKGLELTYNWINTQVNG